MGYWGFQTSSRLSDSAVQSDPAVRRLTFSSAPAELSGAAKTHLKVMAMRIDAPQITAQRMQEFRDAGHWLDSTTNEVLETHAQAQPDKLALVDHRIRLSYAEYYCRVQRLAAKFVAMGLTVDDVIAIQLPNWNEFAVALNASMMIGVPFCQYHSDFRARETEFILSFTQASVLILPQCFKGFDYLAMIEPMRVRLPQLKHVLVVGDELPNTNPEDYFDLRAFLDDPRVAQIPSSELASRRPHGDDLMRTAFTSGTTGDPKAVLHLHNTTNCALKFLNRGQCITADSVLLTFLPVGLNWGLFNILQAIHAGCSVVLQDTFKPEDALQLVQDEQVTHVCCAPAHLVSMLNVADAARFDLTSLQVIMTGGASCPIEVIQEVQQRIPGQLLEMYGMLECGTQCHTLLSDDPQAVCGTVGRPVNEMGIRVVDDAGRNVAVDEVGEILTYGPSVTIGYYNNPAVNARSFTADGWFHTGDQGAFDEHGYLRIVGRKKEMLIRGGANIYPREIEEVLYQHPKVMDAAVVGVPDARLGERVCACIVPRAGQTLSFDEIVDFLRDKIATYKLPEFLQVLDELPRTPTGKVQKGPLQDLVLKRMA
jgi:non-ribosomal peptide synthetase component E (peptide arylation enzyme)